MFQPRRAILAASAVVAALFSMPLAAQPATGKITGTVRVVNGDTITGATVAVTNQQTGVATTATTGPGGVYEVGGLAPGLYTVSADVQGFRAQIVRDRRLEAGGTDTVDISLQVKFS